MSDTIITGYSEAAEAAEVAGPCQGCREKPADPFVRAVAQAVTVAYHRGLEAGRAWVSDPTHHHGMGQKDAVTDVSRWLELRYDQHADDTKHLVEMLRDGSWLMDLERLEGMDR